MSAVLKSLPYQNVPIYSQLLHSKPKTKCIMHFWKIVVGIIARGSYIEWVNQAYHKKLLLNGYYMPVTVLYSSVMFNVKYFLKWKRQSKRVSAYIDNKMRSSVVPEYKSVNAFM